MVFREINGYSENHTKPINTPCGSNAEIIIMRQVVDVFTGFLKDKSAISLIYSYFPVHLAYLLQFFKIKRRLMRQTCCPYEIPKSNPE